MFSGILDLYLLGDDSTPSTAVTTQSISIDKCLLRGLNHPSSEPLLWGIEMPSSNGIAGLRYGCLTSHDSLSYFAQVIIAVHTPVSNTWVR